MSGAIPLLPLHAFSLTPNSDCRLILQFNCVVTAGHMQMGWRVRDALEGPDSPICTGLLTDLCMTAGHLDGGGWPLGCGPSTGLPQFQIRTARSRHQVHLHEAFRYVRPAGLHHRGKFDLLSDTLWINALCFYTARYSRNTKLVPVRRKARLM
jgi:hypothetical protein